MFSELSSALVELMGCSSCEDICMQNGIEDEWVGGFGLVVVEVGCEHIGMLLLK